MGPGVLSKLLDKIPKQTNTNLLVGFETSDDAAIYKINDDLATIQTVDFFPPMVDDPFIFGQVAATNAISDIYAMGALPSLAMNILCAPPCLDLKVIEEILQGGYSKANEAGIVIAGGHSIMDNEPKYGLCVTGFAKPSEILTNADCKEGDVLILTKPIGIGILTSAHKGNLLSQKQYDDMVNFMTRLNLQARNVIVKNNPHGCTDVTGFGLLGHVFEMAKASQKTIVLEHTAVPILGGVSALADAGCVPGGTMRNLDYLESHIAYGEKISMTTKNILGDPQTSGGLIVSMSEKDAIEAIKQIPDAQIIGYVKAFDGKCLQVI